MNAKLHPLEALAGWLKDFHRPVDELVRELDNSIREAIIPDEQPSLSRLDECLDDVKKLGSERLAREIERIVANLENMQAEIAAAVASVFFLKLTDHSAEQIRRMGMLAGLARNFKPEKSEN